MVVSVVPMVRLVALPPSMAAVAAAVKVVDRAVRATQEAAGGMALHLVVALELLLRGVMVTVVMVR